MKHDCNNCPVRSLFDSVFPVTRERSYDLTCTEHCCGCMEYFLYDDTPGFREKDEWFNSDNCMLDKESNTYPLPLYKGTYEDLLKTR